LYLEGEAQQHELLACDGTEAAGNEVAVLALKDMAGGAAAGQASS